MNQMLSLNDGNTQNGTNGAWMNTLNSESFLEWRLIHELKTESISSKKSMEKVLVSLFTFMCPLRCLQPNNLREMNTKFALFNLD